MSDNDGNLVVTSFCVMIGLAITFTIRFLARKITSR
ncbi:unannotated protein [freshwater metagenome]|uniref:Unannotated protein n=1 Tax=freshwater metagenome TaxID=449393 RepID=A0A6J6B109_9ZZZZ